MANQIGAAAYRLFVKRFPLRKHPAPVVSVILVIRRLDKGYLKKQQEVMLEDLLNQKCLNLRNIF